MIRKILIKGKDNITIHSDVLEEEVTEEEYRKIYNTRSNELYNLKEAMRQAKDELQEILAIKETPQLQEFTEMLVKADKLKNKEKTIENIKKMEKEIKQQELELEQFAPAMKKLQQK